MEMTTQMIGYLLCFSGPPYPSEKEDKEINYSSGSRKGRSSDLRAAERVDRNRAQGFDLAIFIQTILKPRSETLLLKIASMLHCPIRDLSNELQRDLLITLSLTCTASMCDAGELSTTCHLTHT